MTGKVFNEKLVVVHKIMGTPSLKKAVYVGMCILDFSKTLMYDFHCNYIKKKYNDKLLFADTVSLTYEIETEDAYKDFWSDKDKFDYSEYPENSPSFDKSNTKSYWKVQR